MVEPTRARRSLELEGPSARVAVVADTHGRPHPRLGHHLKALQPSCILHAGDVGAMAVLDDLARVAPVHAVRGNIDGRARELPDVLTLDVALGGAPLLTILLLHHALVGPRLLTAARRTAQAEAASLVVCGHSHVPFAGVDGDLTVLNPGSVGPRRFQLPVVFAVIELARAGVAIRHLDCETGAPFRVPEASRRARAAR